MTAKCCGHIADKRASIALANKKILNGRMRGPAVVGLGGRIPAAVTGYVHQVIGNKPCLTFALETR